MLYAIGHLACRTSTAALVHIHGMLDLALGIPTEVHTAQRWRWGAVAAKQIVEKTTNRAANGTADRPEYGRTYERTYALAHMLVKVVECQKYIDIRDICTRISQRLANSLVHHLPLKRIDTRDDSRRVSVFERFVQVQHTGRRTQVTQIPQRPIPERIDIAQQPHHAAKARHLTHLVPMREAIQALHQRESCVDLVQLVRAVTGGPACRVDVALVRGGVALCVDGVGAQRHFTVLGRTDLAHQVTIGIGDERAAVGQRVVAQALDVTQVQTVELTAQRDLLLAA